MTTDNTVASFVIKIWLEESKEESGRAVWRGRITHVAGGQQQFLERTEDILAFIRPYLRQMGVESDDRWSWSEWPQRLARWLASNAEADSGVHR